MRDPRIFLEEYRSGQNARGRLIPITHLRGSHCWAYAGWALVTFGVALLLLVIGAGRF